jgi:tetratricopeptide (TPR) repeat protein
MASVRRYLELAPDHPNAHDSYAEMLAFHRLYPQALTHYQHAIDRNPGFNQAYVGMAEVFHAVGQLESAVAQMELAVEHAISPNNASATLRQLASIQAQHGDRDGAMRSLGRAARAASEAGNAGAEATAHRQMALTDALMNGGRSAQAHLDQAAQLTRADSPVQHLTAGLVHAATGNLQGARASGDAFFEATDRNASAASWRKAMVALAMLHGGDAEGAIAELNGADVTLPGVKAVYSRAYAAAGFPVAAERMKRDLLENETVVLGNMFEMWTVMVAQED